MSAILAVPMFAGVMIAVDTTRSLNAKSIIQNAADSAALAAATLPPNIDDKTVYELVNSFFAANGAVASVSRETKVSLAQRETYVEVTAYAMVDNAFALPGMPETTRVEVAARAGKVGLGS
ncbi:MAG: hypothetical protein HC779_03435 [Phyllobacteriaceae bacterium]|nr:hypothetical protein [Phyllobacteriaceae bacterium]